MDNIKVPIFNKLTSKVPGIIFQFRISPNGKASMPFANERLMDIFGVSPESVVEDADSIFGKVYGEDLESLYDSIEVSRSNLTDWEYEFRIVSQDGDLRWIRGVARPELQEDKSFLWNGYMLDVTDKIQVEHNNVDIRAKYQGYFENAPEGLFVLDREGFFIEANPEACKMTGYSSTRLYGMQARELINPVCNSSQQKIFEKSFTCGSVDEEVLLTKASGESFWARLVTSRVSDDLVIVFCEDISQRKQQEEMLSRQLQFQKLIATISSNFVNSTIEDFDEVVNNALALCGTFFSSDRCYVFLFSPDHKLMSNTHEWCSEGIEPQKDELQNFVISSINWWWGEISNRRIINIDDVNNYPGLGSKEKELFNAQGIQSLLSIPMINNGGIFGFFGLDRVVKAKDWTDQEVTQFNLVGEIISSVFSKRKAEMELRLSENRYRLLAENARDVIFRISFFPQKKYEYVSPSSVLLTGYTPEEYYKNPHLDLDVVNEDNISLLYSMYQNPGKSQKLIVLKLNHKDGRQIWCEQSNVAFYDEKGNLMAVEGIARDISNQKEFEHKLKELNQQLLEKKEALESLNQNLEDRIAVEVDKNRGLDHLMALQERQAALGEMIASIAHQWRQPLNLLSLAIYDLADAFDFGELDKKYIENTVEEMNRVIQGMSKTIDDFRSFFKPENEKTIFPLARVVNNTISVMTPYFEKDAIRLLKDLHPEIEVEGYPFQLEQVVAGLLKNAVDAMHDILPEDREISIKTIPLPQAKGCRLEVINTGQPLPDELMPRIFEPYFTTKPEGKGVGLGLYIAKTIVEKSMNGNIFCENTSNGVKFVVLLPLVNSL